MANIISELKTFRNGGMDTDSSIEAVAPQDYLQGYNIRLSGTAEGDSEEVTNIEGNTLITSTRPAGINKCIGAFGFELVRKAYAFIYNSNAFNLITEIDYDTLTETTIFENKTNSSGDDILPLNPQMYVTDCKLLQGRYLIFTYGTVPYYVDLELLKNNPFSAVIQEDLLLLKGQPLTQPLTVYNNDSGRSVNSLKNRLFQFRTQFEKPNFELTAWGTISKRIVPTDEPTPTLGTDVTKNNNIIVSVNIGNDRNKKVNIAARYDLLDWFLVKSVERADIIALPDTQVDVEQEIYEAYDPSTNIYSFAFYNDENYENINVLETDENYDHIWNAQSVELINGSILAIAGLNEGYDRPTVDVNISVSSYDPNITTSAPPYNFMKIVSTTNQRVSGSHRRRITVGFDGLPKTGDVFTLQVRDIRDVNSVINYSVTVTPTQQDNLVAFLALICTVIPNSANFISNGVQTIGILTASYFELSIAKIDLANAGSGLSKSIHGVKSNSSYQLALAHYDGYGRYFPIVTDKRFVQKTPSYAQIRGLLSRFDWQINSLPPLNAVTYQWLISLNLTHATDLFINGTYVADRSTADYLVFNIKSLKKFNDTNSSSVLGYEYSPGDRVTLHFTFLSSATPIKWFDTSAIDVEVVGFEIVTNTVPEPDEVNYYLKIRKSSTLNISDINAVEVLMEIYSPKKRLISNPDGTTTEESTLFYEIGERYDIVDGDYSVKSGSITEADNYFKTRGLTGNINTNTLYELNVEDFNFSDFYKSDYTSYGRARAYFDETGNADKPASIRYSDTFITGSRINGINRFYGARIYGDGAGETSSIFGFIKKIRMRDSYLICLQELKVGHIPVNISIVEDQVAQRQYAVSDKLLNFVRYMNGSFGIGDAKESYGESQNGTIYFVDPNNSLPIRDGYDGLKVISAKMTKYFRRVLKQAKADKRKIIGWYDVFNDEYNISIEIASGVLTTFSFSDFDWKFTDDYVIDAADLTITVNNNGSTVLDGDGNATFTPANDYVGNAGFTFTFLDGEGETVTKNTCIQIVAGNTEIGDFFFVDLINQELSTLLESNSVLIVGNNIPVAISISAGGEYSVNGGAWTSTAGMVNSGDTVRVRQTSSASFETTTSVTLTVSGYSDAFDVTTKSDIPVEYYLVTDEYGLSGIDSDISCAVGMETESLYTTNADGTVDVGDCFYVSDGMGGYNPFGIFPPISGGDPTYYWISYFEGATKVWVKLGYDSATMFVPGDVIFDKGTCAVFTLVAPEIGLTTESSEGACAAGTGTETPVYTDNPDGMPDVGEWFYQPDGLGGYEPLILEFETEFYWLSLFFEGIKYWYKIETGTGVTGINGDIIAEKGVCSGDLIATLNGYKTDNGVNEQYGFTLSLPQSITGAISLIFNCVYDGGTYGSTIILNAGDTLVDTGIVITNGTLGGNITSLLRTGGSPAPGSTVTLTIGGTRTLVYNITF